MSKQIREAILEISHKRGVSMYSIMVAKQFPFS